LRRREKGGIQTLAQMLFFSNVDTGFPIHTPVFAGCTTTPLRLLRKMVMP
jgi:hypothetical protein